MKKFFAGESEIIEKKEEAEDAKNKIKQIVENFGTSAVKSIQRIRVISGTEEGNIEVTISKVNPEKCIVIIESQIPNIHYAPRKEFYTNMLGNTKINTLSYLISLEPEKVVIGRNISYFYQFINDGNEYKPKTMYEGGITTAQIIEFY